MWGMDHLLTWPYLRVVRRLAQTCRCKTILAPRFILIFHVAQGFALISESRWSSSPPPAGHSDATDDSASPSAGGSGLLSLPWEMVSHIASHLPAQCVITVLPKVSQTSFHWTYNCYHAFIYPICAESVLWLLIRVVIYFPVSLYVKINIHFVLYVFVVCVCVCAWT